MRTKTSQLRLGALENYIQQPIDFCNPGTGNLQLSKDPYGWNNLYRVMCLQIRWRA